MGFLDMMVAFWQQVAGAGLGGFVVVVEYDPGTWRVVDDELAAVATGRQYLVAGAGTADRDDGFDIALAVGERGADCYRLGARAVAHASTLMPE